MTSAHNQMLILIQAYSCGPAYAGVALSTVTAYTVFTLGVTQWRTQFRVNMNKVGQPDNTIIMGSDDYKLPQSRLITMRVTERWTASSTMKRLR